MCLDHLSLKLLHHMVCSSNLTIEILLVFCFIKISAQVIIHFSKIQQKKKIEFMSKSFRYNNIETWDVVWVTFT